jgi:hypothetical protein
MGKKRRWFQFHLLTAMLMMITAAGLLWCNTRITSIPTQVGFGELRSQGWPIEFDCHLIASDGFDLNFGNSGTTRVSNGSRLQEIRLGFYVNDLLLDVAVAVGLLSFVTLLSEYLIRRKSGQVSSDTDEKICLIQNDNIESA